ncbi:MAG: response regulator [Anaerolineae bacterium]|nr:response regulator [Anaerolineae bacterium]
MVTILIIDDDAQYVRLVKKLLGAHGHTVLSAGTALSGLKLAEGETIDLVLLDMDLPDLDGKVVATTLRTRPGMRNVPIVAVTAQMDGTARRLALAFGCDGFISKPIDTRLFSDQILSYMRVKNEELIY